LSAIRSFVIVIALSIHAIFEGMAIGESWRALTYQEVRLRIGPLAKLGRFKSTADNFLVYIVTISFASDLVSRSDLPPGKVLHEWVNYHYPVKSQLHQHFTLGFSVQKSFAQLFSSYSLALNFLAKE